jgi:PIN domain nuclease of toxin-antitoxin system
MRFLLDTHSYLWFIARDPRLSPSAHQLIADPANVRIFSLAGAWEMAIRVGLGKLTLQHSLSDMLRRQAEINKISLMRVTVEHIVHVATLPPHHRDPFDRMIAAQALFEQLPIVSADAIFDAYGVTRLW